MFLGERKETDTGGSVKGTKFSVRRDLQVSTLLGEVHTICLSKKDSELKETWLLGPNGTSKSYSGTGPRTSLCLPSIACTITEQVQRQV